MHSSLNWRIEESGGPSELVPDQLLPVQFADLLHGPPARTPELRLMAAVLEDAIRTFCRCTGSRGGPSQDEIQETAEWFESSDVTWPFSFENICAALGLESEWIRQLLHRWRAGRTSGTHQRAKIPSVRRLAGSRHTITARVSRLRRVTRVAC